MGKDGQGVKVAYSRFWVMAGEGGRPLVPSSICATSSEAPTRERRCSSFWAATSRCTSSSSVSGHSRGAMAAGRWMSASSDSATIARSALVSATFACAGATWQPHPNASASPCLHWYTASAKWQSVSKSQCSTQLGAQPGVGRQMEVYERLHNKSVTFANVPLQWCRALVG